MCSSDLSWQRTLAAGGSMQVGLSRTTNSMSGRVSYLQSAHFMFGVPGRRSLQVVYSGDDASRSLSVTLGGQILQRRDSPSSSRGPTVVTLDGSLEGVVYVDVDANGRYDVGMDRPLSGILVSLDDGPAVRTDELGHYRVGGIQPGAHRVRGDLTAVPASMVFSGPEERRVAIQPSRRNRQDFPVVVTGSIGGRLTHLALSSETGQIEKRPLVDARVFVDPQHDTLSGLDGTFFLGGLPPGDYRLQVDAATVPAGFVLVDGQGRVALEPGRAVRDVTLQLQRQVVTRELPPQREDGDRR